MPSSGWLSALTKHFTRTPTHAHAQSQTHTRAQVHQSARPGGNGIATVSSQGSQNASHCLTPPSRPTTPWSLDTLDQEIKRAQKGGRSDVEEFQEHHHYHYSRQFHDNTSGAWTASPRTVSGDVVSMSMMESQAGGSRDSMQTTSRQHSDASRPTSAASSRSSSRPQSGASGRTSRPTSAASRPSSAASRPTSAASRLSSPGHPLIRAHAQAQTSPVAEPSAGLPAQIDDPGTHEGGIHYDSGGFGDARGHYYIPPVIPPLYDRPIAAPTPASTRCNTPVWDIDGEKRVRFLEPEVVGETPSRPPSANSQYSQVIKNSTRFAFQPSQPGSGESGGHNPRYCNCPCHFFPAGRRSVGVQARRGEGEPRPRHYRLLLTPTTHGLDRVNLPGKCASFMTRALLSQVGLVVVVVAWWVAGAAIFSTVEGSAESETVHKMASLRTDLVLGLATELRQVLPYDVVWRTKIELYMGRLEAAVLDAARAGYASQAPTWTMSGALLYSASLTTLVGPGGMTLRTGFSRIFAVLFSLVGAPLVLLLAVSGAFTIREGVGKAWAWRCGRGKQQRVSDSRGTVVEGRAGQYGSGRAGSAVSTLNLATRPQSSTSMIPGGEEQGIAFTPNGPGELPGSAVPPTSAKPSGRTPDLPQPSRVPVLESTLRPSSATPSALDTDGSGTSNAPSSSDPTSSRTQGEQIPGSANFNLPRRSKLPLQSPPRRQPPATAPWGVYLVLLILYLILGLVIFAPIQRWSLPSSIYILFSTLLTLDHGNLGEKQVIGSSKIVVPYVLYMLLGLILVAALIMSVWANICNSLVNTGKYLTVVRPTPR